MSAEPPVAGEPQRSTESDGSRGGHGSAADESLAESLSLEESGGPGDHGVEYERPGGAVGPPADGRPSGGPLANAQPVDAQPVDAQPVDAQPVGAGPDDLSEQRPPGGRLGRRSKKPRAKAPWWELPLLIVVAVLVAMLLKTFVVQPYYIPSESMEQTLHGCPGCSGDRILVNKPIYDLRDPHPGDIIVFKAPAGWDPEVPPSSPSNPILKAFHWAGQLVGLVPPNENDLVKRVIAVGGQTIKCCDAQGNIQISDSGPNGPWHSLNEPYVFENVPIGQRSFGPVTVPKGRLWVMGDHRSVSADSRYHYVTEKFSVEQSTVPVSSVIGKAVLIVWPPSRWRTLGTPSTFKQLALGVGGTATPVLGAAALVVPVWVRRRRRR